MRGCTASSAPARSSITTSSCSPADPGGLEHSVALAQARDRGAWPGCLDELWTALSDRYGRSDAARQMVDVVLLCRDHGPDQVAMAVRGALIAGAIDGRAVAVLARRAHSTGGQRRRRSRASPRGSTHSTASTEPHRLRPAARRHTMTTTPARNAQTAALEALIEAHAIELKLRLCAAGFERSPPKHSASNRPRARIPRRAAGSRDG